MKTDKEIFDSYESGNIIYMTANGMQEMSMTDFIAQTPDNILKSLNRTEKILINLHEKKPESLKWINDYAVAKTIEALKEKLIEYSSSAIVTTDNVESQQQLQQNYDGLKAADDILQQTYNEVYAETISLKEQLKNTDSLKTAKDKYQQAYNELFIEVTNVKEQLNTANDLIDKYKTTIQDNKNEIDDLNTKLNVIENNKISAEPFNIILTINPVDNSVISYRSSKTCGYVAKEKEINNDVPVNNFHEQISDTTNTNKVNTNKNNTNKFMSDEMPNIII